MKTSSSVYEVIYPKLRTQLVTLRLDREVVALYDKLAAKLRMHNIPVSRSYLMQIILTDAILKHPEIILIALEERGLIKQENKEMK